MLRPQQTIHVDRAAKLIDVRVSGLLSPEDASWMGEEVRAAILTLGDGVGAHLSLYDVSALAVAPAQTIAAIQQTYVHPEVRRLWARKVAIVTGSTLGKLQMQRFREVRADIRIFEDRGEALQWLLG